MERLYKEIIKAKFVERPNRFVVKVALCSDGEQKSLIDNHDATEVAMQQRDPSVALGMPVEQGQVVAAHLPNPGRMWELLFPGVVMYIVPHAKAGSKTKFRVIGIERDGVPIMLDTNYSNDVAAYLIDEKQIPGWEEWHVVRREYTVGHSRFDLLLTNEAGEDFLLEVKSCTLFSTEGAMFPDAITERGRKHLLHLASLREDGYRTGILFLVQWSRAHWFLPDYHTDLAFATTFKEVAPVLDWKAVAVAWTEEFTMPKVVRQCVYKHEVVAQEGQDRGDYFVVLELPEDIELEIGSKGLMHFQKGYYTYVGSAKANLTKRLERHKRKRKNLHWHLDYFRSHCDVVAALPVRSSADLECEMSAAMKGIAQWEIKGFGCSDCDCSSHLYGTTFNPIHNEDFMQVVEDFRMNRLDSTMK
ncbi:DNA/RNA nuclease SfsA [uncultured Veillonella sp.]|uniref:DNA/RNA nuclease SfsA n=1 Tax=uncultured Veillonella sp. TaxID=159268 RepID=UPI00261869D5|nr:DNA/RNA nuclease SfsA [uncultured Veillonella sp.]